MIEFFRWLRQKLFGTKYVTLIDYDGTRTIAPIWFCGGTPVASRVDGGIRDVIILNNGLVRYGCYVERWEPYKPQLFTKRIYPKGE